MTLLSLDMHTLPFVTPTSDGKKSAVSTKKVHGLSLHFFSKTYFLSVMWEMHFRTVLLPSVHHIIPCLQQTDSSMNVSRSAASAEVSIVGILQLIVFCLF